MKKIIVLFIALIFAFSCNYLHKPTEYPLHPEVDIQNLPQTMTAEVLWMLGRVSDPQVSPNGEKILYGVTWYNAEDNSGKRDLYLASVNDPGNVTRITMSDISEFNARWRPDGKRIGYLAPNDSGIVQIWEMDLDGSNIKILTGFKESVTGFEYSPDGSRVLYTMEVKLDQTPNDIHPDLPKANAFIADNLMYRHWDSWHNYKYSHIFYSDYNSQGIRSGVDIMEDERYDSPMKPFGGMEQIAWSPDGSKIAYTCKKLSGLDYTTSTNSEIYLYDINNGKTENLSRAGFDGYDHNPVFSPDGENVAWRSMETPGFESDKRRIIVYSFKDGVTKDLSRNFDQNADHFVWSNSSNTIYFISGINATYQIYSIDTYSLEIKQITEGHHNFTSLAKAGDHLIAGKMTHSMPVEIFAVNINGTETQLTTTNNHILDNIIPARSEERWIETTDGKMMHTWVIYPPNFDSLKSYPTLLYCQGGPQSAVSQFFSFRWNFQMMAANNYIIVAPNRRGVPTFGQEWNDQISGDYGGQNMKDYLAAIDTVAKEAFVNENRLGAVGASYGGFSVFWLAGNHDGRFKAFISHCGMFNLESMYGSTEEYFFVNYDFQGAYWEPEAAKTYGSSPHRFIKNWNTPIMVIHGANDFRIPYTESLQAFNSAQLRKIPSKLLFFPDESHFVLKPQNSILWQREFFKWLDMWLKN